MIQTDEQKKAVQMWLQLDRANGQIVAFLGVAKSDYSTKDQADLDAAIASLNEATAWLFDWIYKAAAQT
jgi:hypothetical protein